MKTNSPPAFTDAVSISVGRARKCCLKGQEHPGSEEVGNDAEPKLAPHELSSQGWLVVTHMAQEEGGNGGDRSTVGPGRGRG